MNQIRTIISTGQGRLYLVDSACAIARAGVNVRLVQGWVPKYVPDGAIDLLGRLLGRKKLSAGFAKRRPPELSRDVLKSCAGAEFYLQGMFLLSRAGMMDRSRAACRGWKTFGRASRKHLREADIFHVRSGAGQGGAIQKAKQEGMVVVADHSIAHPRSSQQAMGELYRQNGRQLEICPENPFWSDLVLRDCEEADYILVNSDYVKETFVEANFPEEKIYVAYLGVREDFHGLKKDWSRSGTLRLLFTGEFGLRKGATVLLETLQILQKKNVDCRLDIYGSVDRSCKAIVDGLARTPQAVCHGAVPQDHLKMALASADLYVFPSFIEGAANSVMEALSVGLPVITTRSSGVPVTHEQTGLFVPRDDAPALVDAILKLADDLPQRESLGKAAADLLDSRYTWKRYGEKVKAFYQDILSR